MSHECHVKIAIYDTQGKLVRVLEDCYRSAGNHSTLWDGRDTQGIPVASGVYFYRVLAGNLASHGKMVLIK